MPIRDILRLGHPALRTPASSVGDTDLQSDEIQILVDDMLETMRSAGGVGLAAPQIGVSLQLFVYLAVDVDRPREDAEEKVLINPAVEPEAGEPVYDWEGCLSIPDLRGLVPRPQAVRVHALDREGSKLEFRATDYEARIIQHEFDHLNGIVFVDRMRDLRSLAFSAEWERYMTEGDEPPVESEAAAEAG
ncbi:MAG: peptide deformylase [Thermoanaerobaculia bacterium]|nr:peptide deformylase [Thermoanaerobaculia bacterium]